MPDMLDNLAIVLGAYLFGSLPVLYLLGRLRGYDLREEEDLHMALWRKVGRREGALGIIWDLGKGAICVLVAGAAGFSVPVVAAAGVAVVAGQMWPVFYQFDGEKGNSTGLAMALALAPMPLLVALIPMAGKDQYMETCLLWKSAKRQSPPDGSRSSALTSTRSCQDLWTWKKSIAKQNIN